jgi:hypothetical protein
MRLSMKRRLAFGAVAAGMLAGAGQVWGQDDGQASPPVTFTGGPVLVVDHADLSKFFPDERDKGLLRALEMIPARVRELPGEIEEEEFTEEIAELINSALQALARPGRLAVMYDETPTGGLYGYGVLLSVQTKDKAEADALGEKVRGVVAKANDRLRFKPSQRIKGMSDLQFPFGVLTLGARESTDGWRYEVILGTMQDPDAASKALPAPKKGVETLARAYFNARGLSPAVAMAQQMMGERGQELPPQAQGIIEMINSGLETSFEAGVTQNAMVSRTVVRGAKAHADRLFVGTEALTTADLRAFPADATLAYVRRLNAGWASGIVNMILEQAPQAQEGLTQFQEHTGVDLKELAASLGNTVAFYMSETTGGGGLASGVAMISLADRAKMGESLEKLSGVANAAAEAEARGYVKVVGWDEGGTRMYSVRTPGLPLPVELTIALTDKWMVVSALPQGTIAAVRELGRKDGGLVSVQGVKSALGETGGMVEFSYMDTSRSVAGGYWLLSMLGSAVANGVRSPSDPQREPGMVIPLYHDVASGARPTIKKTQWVGDDLVSVTEASRSTVVNAGAALGIVSKVLPFVAAGVAAGAAHDKFGMIESGGAPMRALAAIALPTTDRMALRAIIRGLPRQDRETALIGAILQGAGR